jgi:hypothetical protein
VSPVHSSRTPNSACTTGHGAAIPSVRFTARGKNKPHSPRPIAVMPMFIDSVGLIAGAARTRSVYSCI